MVKILIGKKGLMGIRVIPQRILNNSGTSRRHKLVNHMRKVTSSESGKDNESILGLNKTSYSSSDAKKQKIKPSSSGSNHFNANTSYISDNSAKKAGNMSPGLPYQNSQNKSMKKAKRKTFSSAKKKSSSVKMVNSATKSISPSLKVKRGKGKSIPFNHMNNLKMTRTKDPQDSPCSSFTMDGGNKSTKVDGKTLIEEFNQKYSASEHLDLDSDKSESETTNTVETDGNVAIIHVIDETKKRRQDFKCSTSKLLKHMKYFEKSINGCEDRVNCNLKYRLISCWILVFTVIWILLSG